MAEFFHMGGYAYFVWLSYAIVFVALVYAFVSPLIRHKNLLNALSSVSDLRKRSKVIATLSSTQTDSDSASTDGK